MGKGRTMKEGNRVVVTYDYAVGGDPIRILDMHYDPSFYCSVEEAKQKFEKEYRWLWRGLMQYPRGHDSMFGAVALPASKDTCDAGVFYIDADAPSDACGGGAMCVAEYLKNYRFNSFVDEFTLDTIEGPVVMRKDPNLEGGWWFRNVDTYHCGLQDFGIDLVYAGEWFGLTEIQEHPVSKVISDLERRHDKMSRVGQMKIPRSNRSKGFDTSIAWRQLRSADVCQHFLVVALWGFGMYARCPCGTGTTALANHLVKEGRVEVGETFVTKGLSGEKFYCTAYEADRKNNRVRSEVLGQVRYLGTSQWEFTEKEIQKLVTT